MFSGKKVLVGVTASIAAYKAAYLVRLLKKAGADVKVVMTPSAKEFITTLTLSTLSGNVVYCDFVKGDEGEWNNHVHLGLWADLMVIAPASANTLGKMANGICDNFLLATYLSSRCPVVFAPAMDLDMYKHPSVVRNINLLKEAGNILINPGTGELASGLSGEGRMAEPEEIMQVLSGILGEGLPLKGKKALVTAGPTYEALDPVRFIGNHSTGKMGFAVAESLAAKGAEVVLVAGPVSLKTIHPSIKRIDVQSAQEMYEACVKYFPKSDIGVLAAAVADYRPLNVSRKKIKKGESDLNIELIPTRDILSQLGKEKKKGQLLVGFALETDNEVEHAKEKLKRKNLDFIVLNSLNDKGAGFKLDTNKISIIGKDNKIKNFQLKNKSEVAEDIVKYIVDLLK